MKEFYFNVIDSTQNYAKNLCKKGESNFVVFSDTQDSGRGRNERKWESPLGGLWFSFDLDFNEKNDLLTMTMGIATREVLENTYNSKVQLKWPNDLILDNKKVGGIICEKLNNKVIVGIGINTNIENIKETKAITFFDKTGKKIDNHLLMCEIIEKCKSYINLPKEQIIDVFRKNMAFRGEKCFVSTINEEGKILDINSEGKLLVEINNEIKEIFTGEINVCI